MIIPRELIDRMLQHANKEAPREACGVILGTGERAVEVVPTKNVSKTPEYTYKISPEELLRIFDYAAQKNLEILGFYHSHPYGSVYPSSIDVARASWDKAVYVILNLKGEIKAWRWHASKGEFEEEHVYAGEGI